MASMAANPTPEGDSVAPAGALGCDVSAPSGVGRVLVVFLYPTLGQIELAFDGTAFSPFFSSGSSRTTITDGATLSFVRAGGWPDTIVTMQVYPADADGAIGDTASYSWTVTAAEATVASAALPSSQALASQHDPLGFGVVCPLRRTTTGDYASASGPGLVRSDLEQLVSIVPGEVRWRPSLGTNINRLRQRPNTGALAELARIEVMNAISRWEPRVKVNDVATSGGTAGEKSTRRFVISYKIGNVKDQVSTPD